MDGQPTLLPGRGSTGRLAVAAVVVLAAALVVGVVVWPGTEDLTTATPAVTSTTTSPPAVSRLATIRGWTATDGTASLSVDEVCSLVPVARLQAVTHATRFVPDPLRTSGRRHWGGVCGYQPSATQEAITTAIEVTGRPRGSLADAVTSPLRLGDPETCEEEASLAENRRCSRLVHLPAIGDTAVASMRFLGRGPDPVTHQARGGGRWVVASLLFDAGDFRVELRLDTAIAGQPAATIAIARLVAARLPVGAGAITTVPRPATCTGTRIC